MKVALIDPSLFTPPYDQRLADGLRRRGHRVTLYGKARGRAEMAAEPIDAEPHFYPELLAWKADRWPRKLTQAAKGVLHVRAMSRLLCRFELDAPDVIHFQWTPLPLVDRLFIDRLRRIAPLVLTVHDSRPFNASPGSAVQQIGAIRILQQFDRVIVHTQSARDRLVAYGVPSRQISRIAHGVLHEMRPVAPPPAGSSEILRLLLFGKLKPYKGADILIEAIARLPDAERARVRVDIVGKPYMNTAPLIAAAEKLGDCVRFDFRHLGEEEMAQAFGRADVIVFPYREIEVSGVLMAALRTLRPIIASRIGGFAELLEHGRHGLLVPPGDPQALADAIGRLVREPDIRRIMSQEIETLIDAVPTWDEIAERTTALYEGALAARRFQPRTAEAASPEPKSYR